MEKKRANTMRRYRRKKIDEMIKNGALDLKDDDKPEEEESIRGKPKKYEDTKMMILAVNKNKSYNILFMIMSSKQDIMGKIYFDRSGYGSKQTTLRDAKEKDKTITMKDVEEFFRKNVEQKKQLRGQNSFIPPHPFYEFQMDLFFINDLEEQKFRVGLLMIDIFTKYMVVVPIASKGEGDIASGMMEALKKNEW